MSQGGAAQQTLPTLNVSNNAHSKQDSVDPGISPGSSGLEGSLVEPSVFGPHSGAQGQLWVNICTL